MAASAAPFEFSADAMPALSLPCDCSDARPAAELNDEAATAAFAKAAPFLAKLANADEFFAISPAATCRFWNDARSAASCANCARLAPSDASAAPELSCSIALASLASCLKAARLVVIAGSLPFSAASLNAARFELYLEKAAPFWAIAANAAEWSESAAKPAGSLDSAAKAPGVPDKPARVLALRPTA